MTHAAHAAKRIREICVGGGGLAKFRGLWGSGPLSEAEIEFRVQGQRLQTGLKRLGDWEMKGQEYIKGASGFTA